MIQNRISKDEYYLGIASAVSKRSSCLRTRHGAVIVKDDLIIATGYNGAARGEIDCCEKGVCNREGFAPGDGYHLCCAVHAEANAVISAGRNSIGATLYLSRESIMGEVKEVVPCEVCKKMLINAQIAKLITPSGEYDLYKE